MEKIEELTKRIDSYEKKIDDYEEKIDQWAFEAYRFKERFEYMQSAFIQRFGNF